MKTVLTAAGTFGICRAARWYLDRSSRADTEHLRGHIRLRTLWNHGAAFGLPIGKKWLPVLSLCALTALLGERKQRPAAVGVIIGGGLSNLTERLTEGRVYDYVQFPRAPGRWKRYVYNLADFAIFAGAAALLLPKRKRDGSILRSK